MSCWQIFPFWLARSMRENYLLNIDQNKNGFRSCRELTAFKFEGPIGNLDGDLEGLVVHSELDSSLRKICCILVVCLGEDNGCKAKNLVISESDLCCVAVCLGCLLTLSQTKTITGESLAGYLSLHECKVAEWITNTRRPIGENFSNFQKFHLQLELGKWIAVGGKRNHGGRRTAFYKPLLIQKMRKCYEYH